MPFFIPHDVFKYVLSFKDPRYELVRGGGKTPSAQCMPLNSETHIEDARDSLDGNTLMIWNRSALVHHGTGQGPFDPNHITGGLVRQIEIFSLNRTFWMMFDIERHLDEIREGERWEESVRFWGNHHMRLGTTVGQGYL